MMIKILLKKRLNRNATPLLKQAYIQENDV